MTDAWRPAATFEVLRARARILARIRAFFADRGVLEVETPYLSPAGATDPHIESFATAWDGPELPSGTRLYLHTSPEFPMKRLVAAGSGPIYQICRVFRQGEFGRRHNPEFTLLEWYRPGWDHHALMEEVATLVERLLGERARNVERLTYRDAFLRHLAIDPFRAAPAELAARARERGILDADRLDLERDAWLDLLLTQFVEPHLGRDGITFLHDYPPSQAALARLREGDPTVAERFELYIDGIEIANGFHELGDAGEQRARFEQDRAVRSAHRQPDIPADERLIAALEAGFPDCAGVAIGLDRLVMAALGETAIARTLAFPFDAA